MSEVRCAICGDPVVYGRPHNEAGEFAPHRRHTKAEIATLRLAADEAAAPLVLGVLMYLIDPPGFEKAVP